MARDENPPFERGSTWSDGGTIDSTDLGGANILGKEWVFEDYDPTAVQARSGAFVRCRAVRNTSGIALQAKRLARFSLTAGEYGDLVDGYAAVTSQECYPIDEYLPSGTPLDDDIFWIIIEGPAIITVGRTAGATTNFAVGDWLVSQTAATSQATTAGRAEQILLTGATKPLADMVLNRIGRALTARTTANTGSDCLCYIGKW